VLLKNDFLIVDLLSPGYPCFDNPYPMDIHEAPVTYVAYVPDAPTDLIAAFYSVGRTKRPGYSDKVSVSFR
jgi:syntaxin-binding protein 5